MFAGDKKHSKLPPLQHKDHSQTRGNPFPPGKPQINQYLSLSLLLFQDPPYISMLQSLV